MNSTPARSMLVSLVAHGVALAALFTLRYSPSLPIEAATPRRVTFLAPRPIRRARVRVKPPPAAIRPFVPRAPVAPPRRVQGEIELPPAAHALEAPRFSASSTGLPHVAPPMKTDNFGSASAGAAKPALAVVARGGFGDTVVAVPPRIAPVAPILSPPTPVEIVSKPRPAYTGEARRLHIEGEVLIEVLFSASGEVRVVRVLRGLGNGLDESAVAAAREIRFHPALRDGVAVDSQATVHIFFRLAY